MSALPDTAVRPPQTQAGAVVQSMEEQEQEQEQGAGMAPPYSKPMTEHYPFTPVAPACART